MTTRRTFTRYVAIGDSQTEGLGDGDDIRGHRGFADRLAEILAADEPGLLYANLAVRGRLADQVRTEQLEPALALRPDLVTVMAGMNDLVRSGFDAARTAASLEAMFAALTASGALVVTVTFPDIGRISPLARRAVPRVLDLNTRIREAAARHGALVLDTFPQAATVDPRLWSQDRLHAAPLGHSRIAAGMADVLGVPGHTDWAAPLPTLPTRSLMRRAATEAGWAANFLGPWAVRRIRGRSSGDGRTAKRPALTPVVTPVRPLP